MNNISVINSSAEHLSRKAYIAISDAPFTSYISYLLQNITFIDRDELCYVEANQLNRFDSELQKHIGEDNLLLVPCGCSMIMPIKQFLQLLSMPEPSSQLYFNFYSKEIDIHGDIEDLMLLGFEERNLPAVVDLLKSYRFFRGYEKREEGSNEYYYRMVYDSWEEFAATHGEYLAENFKKIFDKLPPITDVSHLV